MVGRRRPTFFQVDVELSELLWMLNNWPHSNRGKFLGEMIIICLGKIYLGIITSAMLPLLVHALSTIPLNPSGSLFQTPRPVRKIILGTLFHGRATYRRVTPSTPWYATLTKQACETSNWRKVK